MSVVRNRYKYWVILCLVVAISGCSTWREQHRALAKNSKVNNPFVAPATRLKNNYRNSGVQLVENANDITLILDNDRIFKSHFADILEKSKPMLHVVSDLIKEYLPTQVFVTTHSDDVGYKKEHLRLSKHRAESLTAFLFASGIDIHYLHARGMGVKETVADNRTVRGQSYNRRTEIVIPFQRRLSLWARLMSAFDRRY